METLIKKTKPLPIATQIKICQDILFELRKKNIHESLCLLFSKKIETNINEAVYINEVKNYMPIFTKKNAVKYANAYNQLCCYWWRACPFDFENRILFVEWMLEQLLNDNDGLPF